MYEQEDSCIEQEDLMIEYMVYPEYENKILFRVAPLGGIGQIFVVDGESAEVLEPGEREHDNPLFLKRLKFGRAFVWPEHELLDHTLEDNVSSSFLARLCFFL